MAIKLKVNKDFAPCPVADGDEMFSNGIFVFNITKIIEYIQKNPGTISLEEVAVSGFCKEFSSISESHVDTVDIANPVILAEISPERFNLIDGNHRMEKARRMGIESLKAYKLNVEQHLRFLTTQKAYEAFVEYWNDKVKMKSKKTGRK